MGRIIHRSQKEKRKMRTRNKITGTKERPRFTVYRSNRYIYGQLIDDENSETLVGVQDEAREFHDDKDLSKKEAAFEAGKKLAEKAKKEKIKKVVFDRGSYRYHGRVRSFAEGAREGGLKF